MKRKGNVLVIVAAIILQIILGAFYGFATVSVPAWIYFISWCACAAMICKATEALGVI